MRKSQILTTVFVHLQEDTHVAVGTNSSGGCWLSCQNQPDSYNTPLHLFLPTGSDPADMARLADLMNEIIAKAAKAEAV